MVGNLWKPLIRNWAWKQLNYKSNLVSVCQRLHSKFYLRIWIRGLLQFSQKLGVYYYLHPSFHKYLWIPKRQITHKKKNYKGKGCHDGEKNANKKKRLRKLWGSKYTHGHGKSDPRANCYVQTRFKSRLLLFGRNHSIWNDRTLCSKLPISSAVLNDYEHYRDKC